MPRHSPLIIAVIALAASVAACAGTMSPKAPPQPTAGAVRQSVTIAPLPTFTMLASAPTGANGPSPVSTSVVISATASPLATVARTATETVGDGTPGPTRSPAASRGAAQASATPKPGVALPLLAIRMGQPTDMVPGQTGVVEDTGIQVTLLQAHGPAPGCNDCPLTAALQVSRSSETEKLGYSLGGNMTLELLQKASRKTAFGFQFIAAKISENLFTLVVEPVQP